MSDVENVSPREYLRFVERGELWQLLDVREAWEIATASVPGTINIPMAEVAEQRHRLEIGVPLAVLCHSGVRSARVAAYLAATGFGRVVNIDGGIDAWSQTVNPSLPRY